MSRARAREERERMVAAMVELADEHGYAGTTVEDVVARAGVSRRAFEEHFARKRDCFLAAYDEIVANGRVVVESSYAQGSSTNERAGGAIENLFERAIRNPVALRLVIVEAAAIGSAGVRRREQLMAEYEHLLREALGLPAGPGTIPNPVLRGIVGGLNAVLYARVHDERLKELKELVPDLVAWVSSYYPIPPSVLALLARAPERREIPAGLAGGRAPGTLTRGFDGSIAGARTSGSGSGSTHATGDPRRDGSGNGSAYETAGGSMDRIADTRSRRGPRAEQPVLSAYGTRERILDAVANTVVGEGYTALTVTGAAKRAGVSLQDFYGHFSGKEDAFLTAYELGHARALGAAQSAFAAQEDWRVGMRDAIEALLLFLACEPTYAHLALVDALAATRKTAERANEGVATYAAMLAPVVQAALKSPGGGRGSQRRGQAAEGLPRGGSVTIEAIVGGLLELFIGYALLDRIGELPELLPRATYFALAPLVGVEQAAAVATGELA